MKELVSTRILVKEGSKEKTVLNQLDIKGRGLLPGKERNDLKQNELKEIAGKGEHDAEDDLDQHPLLLVLFVQPPIEEPESGPS